MRVSAPLPERYGTAVIPNPKSEMGPPHVCTPRAGYTRAGRLSPYFFFFLDFSATGTSLPVTMVSRGMAMKPMPWRSEVSLTCGAS